MRKLSTLLITTILSGVICAAPVLAQAADAAQQSPSMTVVDKKEYNEMLNEAYTMMGHVGVANIALLYNLTDEATSNVQQALTIARKLEGQTAQLNADFIKLGKLKYVSASGESHDYWLPVVDDTFVVSNLNAEYLKSKQPKAAEEDAQTVTTKVVLDTKQMRDSLEKATAAISARNYGDAQADLITAEQSTFTDQVASALPLVTAHDNLALAKELAKNKDYDGASFALTHAKDALKMYQSSADKGKAVQADKLQTEIGALQTEISKNKPSMVANIEKRIGTWMDEIKGWM